MPYVEIAFKLPLPEVFTYREPAGMSLDVGYRVRAVLGRRSLTGWVVGRSEAPPPGVKLKDVEEILGERPLFGEDLLELARWLASLAMSSLGETLATMLPGGRKEQLLPPLQEEKITPDPVPELSVQQKSALDAVLAGTDEWSYLYGITGSGKTEVFLRAAGETLNDGRDVLYLVPEIALSHHLAEGFRARFHDNLAVFHSGLSPARRLSEWQRIFSGQARIVLGTRSAVFAPLRNLGLVIMDEEHEGSYKSSSTPRYHARQVAMRRCRLSGARLIMGSATPSVEAWKMMENGRIRRLTLTNRPAGGAPPRIRLVDLRGQRGLFSKPLMETMGRTLAEDRQILLFLNRRGFSYHVFCRSCGRGIDCPHCSVPMTYHKTVEAMVCHYCGRRCSPLETCSACGSVDMDHTGFGTEHVEEEVRRLFPERRTMRLDTDMAGKKGVLEKTFRDFREGRIDILLGTQMVAKGLNAPGVKLAALLLADSSLGLPDFRSAERTFALIVQVAGRVGRFADDGEVVIQTLRPDAAPIRLAAEENPTAFYRRELEQRRLLGFPPYSRLFRVVARSEREDHVRTALDALAAELADGGGDWELLGPAECPLGRISGRYRRHIILKSTAFDRTHAALKWALDGTFTPRGLKWEIDVDPVNLL